MKEWEEVYKIINVYFSEICEFRMSFSKFSNLSSENIIIRACRYNSTAAHVSSFTLSIAVPFSNTGDLVAIIK